MTKIDKFKFKNSIQSLPGFEIVHLQDFIASTDQQALKRPHRTEFYNLIFITDGQGKHAIDFFEYTLRSNNLLIVSQHRAHAYSNYDHLNGYIVMFTEEFLCTYLKEHLLEVTQLMKQTYPTPHINFGKDDALQLTLLLEFIYSTYTTHHNILTTNVLASLLRTLILLISNITLSLGECPPKSTQLFTTFSELVDQHVYRVKTVDAYAKMMHVSKKTVNTITRKAIDMSAKEFIIHQLIIKIKLNLRFEQKSIGAIAQELGFIDPSNMTKFLKKYTGHTPKQLRDMMWNVDKIIPRRETMDLNAIQQAIETRVYHITPDMKVPLHEHATQDELFYCIKGSGFGVRADAEVPLNVGDVFVAPAGTLHSLRSDNDLYVTAILVPVNRIVCHCKQVTYNDIRQAMANGAHTVDTIKEVTGAGTGCGRCISEIEKILSIACGCKMVSMETVIDAVKQGTNTTEKLGELTGAGAACGKCKPLLENIISTYGS